MAYRNSLMKKLSSAHSTLFRTKTLSPEEIQFSQLSRCLNVVDLTSIGIGSTLGAGVYVITGQVARTVAGPSVVLSFVIAGLASFLAGICYSEFAARVPRAGSAYTYSYVTVGELWAFIIGWNMILENMIGAASVGKAWSQYLDSLTNQTIQQAIIQHVGGMSGYGLAGYPDFIAFTLLVAATLFLSLGAKFSTRLSSVFTILNLLVITSIIVLGLLMADGRNWSDAPGFFPMGYQGVLAGAATCFYAFVGFDTIATAGEEAQNPSKSIPTAIVVTLVVCFFAYFGVSTALTLMISWKDLPEQATLPMAFAKKGVYGAEYIIAIGGMCGLTASMVNSLFPLPRNLYALAHDGLIFKKLGHINEWTNTPVLATWIVGLVSAVFALLIDLNSLIQLMSIGTLMAYTLVSVCTLILHYQRDTVGLSILEAVDMLPSSTSADLGQGIPKPFADEDTGLLKQKEDGKVKMYDTDTETTVFKRVSNADGTTTIRTEIHRQPDYDCQENVEDRPRDSTYKRMDSNYSLSNLSQLFNLGDSVYNEPTEHTRKIAIISILNGLLFWLIFCIFTLYSSSLPVWITATVVTVLLALVCGCIIVLIRQPRNHIQLHFKVPLVPYIPMASALINIYLMVTLPLVTWLRFIIWIAIGLLIYLTYGIHNSTECRAGDQDVILYNVTEDKEDMDIAKQTYTNKSCETDTGQEMSGVK